MKLAFPIFCSILAMTAAGCHEDHSSPRAVPKLPSEAARETQQKPQAPPSRPTINDSKVESPAGVQFTIPNGWTRYQPKSTMRIAEASAPRADGDASDPALVVYFFGGGAGNFEANVTRWLGQVTGSDGQPIARDQAKIGEFKNGSLTFHTFEADGTITESNPQTMQVTNKVDSAKMIVAMLENDKGGFFFKLTGPTKSVTAAKGDFEILLKSVALKQ